jgi:hypothetical protein
MSTPATITSIACPCGETRLALDGAPFVSLYCHCKDCQVVHGAAYLPAAMYHFAQTRIVAGSPLIWTRKHTQRASCGRCGCRLYAEPPGQWLRSIVATLLPPGLFQPAYHMNCDSALLPVRDRLPHYRGFPAALGGSDECVEW